MPEIIQAFIPKSNENRPGYWMNPEYITIHETANTSYGANAEMHARFVANDPASGVSWHFTADDHVIYQHLPTSENGWHAGDGSRGTGNRKSIGIETCVNVDGDFAQARRNVAWLTAKLMRDHGIPIEKVVPHKRWSGKHCPARMLSDFDDFRALVMDFYNGGASIVKTYLSHGDTGEKVAQLQRDLLSLGYDMNGYGVDGSFGDATEAAVKAFQADRGITVDGFVGEQTRAELDEALAEIHAAAVEPEPSELPASEWAKEAIEWAKANDISDGTSPRAHATRQEVITMLYRLSGDKVDAEANAFPEAAEWAREALTWAVENDISDGTYPTQPAERQAVITMLYRYSKRTGGE